MSHSILYVNPFGAIGGAEKCLLGLLECLDRTRFQPALVAPGNGILAETIAQMQVPYEPLDLPPRLQRLSLRGQRSSAVRGATALPQFIRFVAALAGSIRAAKPSLIHTNGLKAHVAGAIAGRLSRVPVVWHLHDFLTAGCWEYLIARLGRQCAERIITNSEAVKRHAADLGATNVVAIHNGIDLQSYSPRLRRGRIRRELGVSEETPLVGIVGVLARWKGQQVFLRAARRIHSLAPETRFLVVGDEIYSTAGHGGFRRVLEKQVADSGLSSVVHVVGYRADVPMVMADLDVVVHASIEPEPFGLVVLEAMACGRPVVATGLGGVPEVLGENGRAGIMVPAGDADALAAEIFRLVRDKSLRARMGEAGRRRAETYFDIHTHARRVEHVYEEILERR